MNSLSKDIAPEIEESLIRCFEGKVISRQEANRIIKADNSYLPMLMAFSSVIRDSSNGKKISYSNANFFPQLVQNLLEPLDLLPQNGQNLIST